MPPERPVLLITQWADGEPEDGQHGIGGWDNFDMMPGVWFEGRWYSQAVYESDRPEPDRWAPMPRPATTADLLAALGLDDGLLFDLEQVVGLAEDGMPVREERHRVNMPESNVVECMHYYRSAIDRLRAVLARLESET